MKTKIHTATEADGPELLALIEGTQSDGVFSMVATRRPNPVASFQAENPQAKIGLIRDRQQHIAAQFCISPGEYYINGGRCRVGYVSGVRSRPGFHGILDWMAMAEYVRESGCDLYTCSFLADNDQARIQFAKKRKHFPQLFPLTAYTTYIINPDTVTRQWHKSQNTGSSFRAMLPKDRPQVLDFINREAARYQFAPVIDSLSQFNGLRESDCYLLEQEGTIKAFGALWNQSHYKQYIVTGYQSYMKWMERFSRLPQRLGYIPIPKINTVLDFPTLSFCYAEEGNRAWYELFLTQISREIAKSYPMFLIGMAHNHPHRTSIQSLRSIHFDSHLYYVRYDNDLVPDSDRPIHYECGLL